MKIDFVKDKNNFIQVSYYDSINFEINNGVYTIKDFLKWVIRRPLEKASITFNSALPFFFEDIFFVKKGNARYKIEYSIDGLTWNEFPIKEYKNNFYKYVNSYAIYFLTDPTKTDIEQNRTYVEKTDVNTLYSVHETELRYVYLTDEQRNNIDQIFRFDIFIKFNDLFKPEQYITLDERQAIKYVYNNPALALTNECESIRNDGRYLFTASISDSQTMSLFTNFLIKYIKITFYDINVNSTSDFEFSDFSIFGEEEYNIDHKLKIANKNFFNHKYFENKTFIPSVCETYMQMLEDSEETGKYFDSKFKLSIIEIIRGIGYDAIGETDIA